MKIGFMFPGYGNQRLAMGKDIYDNSRIIQEHFDQASSCIDKNFVKLCFASSDIKLSQLDNAYLSIFLLSLSIADILKHQGVVPSVVAGYDIGEFAALASVKALSLPDGLYLLSKYAKLYAEFLEGKRFEAINIKNCDSDQLQELLDLCKCNEQKPQVSVYQTYNQIIMADEIKKIACLKKHLNDVSCGPYEPALIGGGLHSYLMDPVLKVMKQYLEKVDFKDISIPFVASVTGQVLKEKDKLKSALMQQIHAPLRWDKVLQSFTFCDFIVVVGPDNFFKQQLEAEYSDKKILAVNSIDSLNECLTFLKKETIIIENN